MEQRVHDEYEDVLPQRPTYSQSSADSSETIDEGWVVVDQQHEKEGGHEQIQEEIRQESEHEHPLVSNLDVDSVPQRETSPLDGQQPNPVIGDIANEPSHVHTSEGVTINSDAVLPEEPQSEAAALQPDPEPALSQEHEQELTEGHELESTSSKAPHAVTSEDIETTSTSVETPALAHAEESEQVETTSTHVATPALAEESEEISEEDQEISRSTTEQPTEEHQVTEDAL